MNVLIAPDSFKDSLNATQVAAAIREGWLKTRPGDDVRLCPVSDGGEGFIDVLSSLKGATLKQGEHQDALGRPVTTHTLWLSPQHAVIELASASGLQLIEPELRNPLNTSTSGTGSQILSAIKQGARRITLSLGGSATNEAGIGILSVLGARFMSDDSQIIQSTGQVLDQIRQIDFSQLHKMTEGVSFSVLTDVTNRLLGPQGATHIFGPQKGADEKSLVCLEHGMRNWCRLIKEYTGKDLNRYVGGGAAGGVGATLQAILSASQQSGLEFLLKQINFTETLTWADIVITGEGRMDSQSLAGKVPIGVLAEAQKVGKPCYLMAGQIDLTADEIRSVGFKSTVSVVEHAPNKASAMQNAEKWLGIMAAETAKLAGDVKHDSN